jgi:hypothetical protein
VFGRRRLGPVQSRLVRAFEDAEEAGLSIVLGPPDPDEQAELLAREEAVRREVEDDCRASRDRSYIDDPRADRDLAAAKEAAAERMGRGRRACRSAAGGRCGGGCCRSPSTCSANGHCGSPSPTRATGGRGCLTGRPWNGTDGRSARRGTGFRRPAGGLVVEGVPARQGPPPPASVDEGDRSRCPTRTTAACSC